MVCGVLLVKRDSPIRTMADIRGKRLAIGQTDGYEKHHAALDLLRRHGIEPSQVVITEFSSCMENIGAILDEKADAAVVSDYAFDADCLIDIAKKDDFRVMATTEPPIPGTSLMLDMGRVSVSTACRLRQALLDLNSDPDLQKSMLDVGFVKPSVWSPVGLPDLKK
jgi:phosphonate transport system substrate-binding protein